MFTCTVQVIFINDRGEHAYDESSAPASSLDRRDLTVELVNTPFLKDLQSHSVFFGSLARGRTINKYLFWKMFFEIVIL